MTSSTDIQAYAKRNTSGKLTIESKYVHAFVESMLHSSTVQIMYDKLAEYMQNGDNFSLHNSYYPNSSQYTEEPYRSIIAYSMTKKDDTLFELLFNHFFTGKYSQRFGTSEMEAITTTDVLTNYTEEYLDGESTATKSLYTPTDVGLTTDMSSGLVNYSFYCMFCEDSSFGYQSQEELLESVTKIKNLITIVKPARVSVYLFYTPYMYLSGTEDSVSTAGINTESTFQVPFGNAQQMANLKALTDLQLNSAFNGVKTELDQFSYTMSVSISDTEAKYHYEFTNEVVSDLNWGEITIRSGIDGINDVIITPNDTLEQETSDTYYAIFDMVIPRV